MSDHNPLDILQQNIHNNNDQSLSLSGDIDIDIVNEAMNDVLNNLNTFRQNMVKYYKDSYRPNAFEKGADEFLMNLNKSFIKTYSSQIDNIMSGFENIIYRHISRNTQLINKVKAHKDELLESNKIVSYNGYKYTVNKRLNLELTSHIRNIVSDISNNPKAKFENTSREMKTAYFDTIRAKCIGSKAPIKPADFNNQLNKFFKNGETSTKRITLVDDQVSEIIDKVSNPKSLIGLLSPDVMKLKTECQLVLDSSDKIDKIDKNNQLSYLYDANDDTDYKTKLLKLKYAQLVNICGIYLYAIGLKAQMIINSLKQDMYILEHLIDHME